MSKKNPDGLCMMGGLVNWKSPELKSNIGSKAWPPECEKPSSLPQYCFMFLHFKGKLS